MAPQSCPRSQGSWQRPGPAGHVLGCSPGPLCMAVALAQHVFCPDIGRKTLPADSTCVRPPHCCPSTDTLRGAWPWPPQSSLL